MKTICFACGRSGKRRRATSVSAVCRAAAQARRHDHVQPRRAGTAARRGSCDLDVKALVQMIAIGEAALYAKMAASSPPPATPIAIDSLPVRTLLQRPDVFVAEQEVAAASAEVGNARAARYHAAGTSTDFADMVDRSDFNAVTLERERMAAWIALYHAAGGGWRNPNPECTASASAIRQAVAASS